jgi:predicted transcriptional regulator
MDILVKGGYLSISISSLKCFELATTQLLIRLPDELVRRFKRNVSVRQRSMFIRRLLEDALPPEDGGDDDPLYRAALAVEQERALAAEMADWEVATIADGLDDPPKKRR